MERWEDDDSKKSLAQISRHHARSIVPALVEIGQRTASQASFTPFLEHLECLLLPKSPDRQTQATVQLRRSEIDITRSNTEFIALSYTWAASPGEEEASGRYRIEDRKKLGPPIKSKTRDCVFGRVIKYGHSFGVKLLWIDRHCITQDDERECKETKCPHASCVHHRSGMQVMDLVYKYSSHPVALLGRPIESESDIRCLGKLIQGRMNRLKEISVEELWHVLNMLSNIIHDAWWQRAWTFQENFLAGKEMYLLISHPHNLERLKRSYCPSVFGQVDGELRISSTAFSIQVTRFCQALPPRLSPRISAQEKDNMDQIIKCLTDTAGRYSILLKTSDSMTPIIVGNVENRGVTDCWDRLPIVANCSRYKTRLDEEQLKKIGHSLSLSMLAMCLLNGEVPDNAKRRNWGDMTVLESLKSAFLNIRGPSVHQNLSFNRGCRLTRVALRREGIHTKGHLWKLGRIIDNQSMAWVEDAAGCLELDERQRLVWLADTVRSYDDYPLSDEISKFLGRDAWIRQQGSRHQPTFTNSYQKLMSQELAEAIAQGKKLRLGRIYDPLVEWASSPYMAVFIWDPQTQPDGDDEMDIDSPDTTIFSYRVGSESPEFVFTSFKEDEGHIVNDASTKDLDRHVSFEVEMENGAGHEAVPKLRIKRWISGLCFFRKRRLVDVIFPWPTDLVEI
ncbi:hypothetical protein B0H67DRAFT_647878 [Lasiosphaeris hirsuta]|uniref:Heterokaryon incompatibility domain-containing protein n=1 Tax=Lasiosphaeris hirsuta TaxID=260670 RepID=A0AA40A293_9PEZI|nr:hypothetical protein B0H67DRAFT_647878 [Lasiosphaeris hirsuta]